MAKHEILISDVIGGTIYGMDLGVTAHRIKRELDMAKDEDDILVRINSPGGSVFEAATIFNLLRDRGVDVQIDGLAASAATVVAMAGRKITMAENAMLMVHNPWGLGVGEAHEMRKLADVLDKVKTTIVDTYHGRTGIKKPELSKMMDSETWLTASEAKKSGFVDSLVAEARVEMRFDLEKFGYKNKPADWPPTPPVPPRSELARQIEAQLERMKI